MTHFAPRRTTVGETLLNWVEQAAKPSLHRPAGTLMLRQHPDPLQAATMDIANLLAGQEPIIRAILASRFWTYSTTGGLEVEFTQSFGCGQITPFQIVCHAVFFVRFLADNSLDLSTPFHVEEFDL